MTTTLVRGELPLLPGVKASATLSPCGRYRYGLHRDWYPKTGAGHVLWIMLNPSSADADVDDRTVRKCQEFARRWGFDGITVCNLYALRATEPADLWRSSEPVGEANDDVLRCFLSGRGVGRAVAAWGAASKAKVRAANVVNLAMQEGRELHALRVTKTGAPEHPLYVPYDVKPVVWRGLAA